MHIRYISRQYSSSSYMKVIGSRSTLQEPKTSRNSYPRMYTLVAHNSGFISEHELVFTFAICRHPSVCLSSVVYL